MRLPFFHITSLGAKGEHLAEAYLRKNGFRILARNYRFQRAEIDLIVQEGNEIVFVEVKTRSNDHYGSGEEAVTAKKQAQIRKAAEGYITQHSVENILLRFDVVVVEFHGTEHLIRHLRNAF